MVPAGVWVDYVRGHDGLIHYNTIPHNARCLAGAWRGTLYGPGYTVTCWMCVADRARDVAAVTR